MIVTQQAAVHLGNDNLESMNSTKKQPQRAVKQQFDMTKCDQGSERTPRHIRDQLVTKFLEKDDLDHLPCSAVINSVKSPESAWKEKVGWFMNSSQCQEMNRIVGETMELEWKCFLLDAFMDI